MSRNYSSTAVDTTLNAGISAGATSLVVVSATGFPAAPFILALSAGTATQELVLVTAMGGTTLTVTRGYDSTVATTHDAGATVRHSHAAIDFRESRTHEAATSGVHGVTGDLSLLAPPGIVVPYAGSAAPSGWLLAEGQAVSRTTYAALFNAVGTTYGAGDGSTTFALPNLKGLIPVGKDAAQTEFDTLGEKGGAKTHTLTTSEMPTHTHVQNAHTHTQDAHTHTQDAHQHPAVNTVTGGKATVGSQSNLLAGGNDWYAAAGQVGDLSIQLATATNQNATATNQNTTATNQNTGGGAAHNNLQPYIALNYIIKA